MYVHIYLYICIYAIVQNTYVCMFKKCGVIVCVGRQRVGRRFDADEGAAGRGRRRVRHQRREGVHQRRRLGSLACNPHIAFPFAHTYMHIIMQSYNMDI